MQYETAVLDRMREAGGFKTDTALAGFLSVPAGTIAAWRHRGSVPAKYILLFSAKSGAILDWLATGTGPMRRTGLIAGSIDPDLLAVATDQADRWASLNADVTRREHYTCAELAHVIVAMYGDLAAKLHEFEKAQIDRETAIKSLRLASGLPEKANYVTWWPEMSDVVADLEARRQRQLLEEVRRGRQTRRSTKGGPDKK